MIKLNNAQLDYPRFKLGPINLQLNLGEFISVVGPSGSGKSTLIRVITGHNKLSSGSIEYKECTSNDIMYISQKGTTFNHLNVRENLKLKYDYSEKQIIECLELVGLSADFLWYCVSALVAMVAFSWHQILVYRSKFQQSTHRNQHFAASGVVYHILKLSLMPGWSHSYYSSY